MHTNPLCLCFPLAPFCFTLPSAGITRCSQNKDTVNLICSAFPLLPSSSFSVSSLHFCPSILLALTFALFLTPSLSVLLNGKRCSVKIRNIKESLVGERRIYIYSIGQIPFIFLTLRQPTTPVSPFTCTIGYNHLYHPWEFPATTIH